MARSADQRTSSPNFTRQSASEPLLLLHGLGGNLASWSDTATQLAKTNEIIAVGLPGHGASPVLPHSGTFAGVADGVADFIRAQNPATVALAPGGFWNDNERR